MPDVLILDGPHNGVIREIPEGTHNVCLPVLMAQGSLKNNAVSQETYRVYRIRETTRVWEYMWYVAATNESTIDSMSDSDISSMMCRVKPERRRINLGYCRKNL